MKLAQRITREKIQGRGRPHRRSAEGGSVRPGPKIRWALFGVCAALALPAFLWAFVASGTALACQDAVEQHLRCRCVTQPRGWSQCSCPRGFCEDCQLSGRCPVGGGEDWDPLVQLVNLPGWPEEPWGATAPAAGEAERKEHNGRGV